MTIFSCFFNIKNYIISANKLRVDIVEYNITIHDIYYEVIHCLIIYT